MTNSETVPLVSVIIPTYNSASTINVCLHSLAEQNFRDFEIVIQDGGSTDKTISIAQTFTDKVLKMKIFSEADRGIYDAMNKGIENARGQWILFLGSDDRIHDAGVFANVAGRLVNSKASVVYGDVFISGNTSWSSDGTLYDGPFTISKLFEQNLCHQGIFYRKEIFKTIGYYNTDYPVCADWDLNLRCFAYCKTEYINRAISVFVAGGYTTVKNTDRFTSRDLPFKIKKYFNIGLFDKRMRRFTYVFSPLVEEYRKSGNYLKATYYLMLVLFHSNHKSATFKFYLRKILR